MVWEHASPKPWPYYFRRCIGLRSNGHADASTQSFLALQRTGVLRHALQQIASSFDHLVGTLLKTQRHFEAERLGGLQVDHQLELDRNLDGKLARLRALQNFIHIRRRAPKIIALVISVR